MTQKQKISEVMGTKKKGITLLETLLALSIGAAVIVASVQGMNRYSENVQVQAAATQMSRLIEAADTWGDDRYSELVAAGPQILTPAQTQARLIDYLGGAFPNDPFRNSYRLVTRTYTYRVPDPVNPGFDIDRDALQIMLVSFNTDPGPLATEDDIRINIANTAGARSGFVSTDIATCSDGAGGALPAGNICGAFGSYALLATDFPANSLDDAFNVALITKGDSSFYGDQLYRYDYGDPELNTMRTRIIMDATDPIDNEIESNRNPLRITAHDATSTSTSTIELNNDNGAGLGDITLAPGTSNRTVLIGNGAEPILRGDGNVLQINEGAGRVRLGDVYDYDWTAPDGSALSAELGEGEIRGTHLMGEFISADAINSIFPRSTYPLRMQAFSKGHVIIGSRGQYTPLGGLNPGQTRYELADGVVTTGLVKAQDITCADCGGSLSEILPRWRHMGTYYVAYTTGTGTRVPKPNCGTRNIRGASIANGGSREQNFNETRDDNRYRPGILLTPRRLLTKRSDDATFVRHGGNQSNFLSFDSYMRAENDPLDDDYWRVSTHQSGDNIYTTVMAMTYCIYMGGAPEQQDPTSDLTTGFGTSTLGTVGTWTSKETGVHLP